MVSLHSVILVSAVAHLVIASVMALFARHKVQYLAIAWIVGIFGVAVACVLPFVDLIVRESAHPAILHPGTLFGLMAWVFLQSIYPLGITMPGYLQWERMWGYALPVIGVSTLYGLLTWLGMTSPNYYTWEALAENLLTVDVLLRMVMLGVSIYYIVNIFRLPRIMLRDPQVPHYLHAYAFVLGVSSCLYLWVIMHFTILGFEIWVVVFTLANLYLCMRTLETLALGLPKPEIRVVEELSAEEPQGEDERDEDFNEANRQRFERMEYWMQHNREAWKDYTFGRDQLCQQVGINRHLALQCVRSQGYNNIHEYINTYRVLELQRMITYGEAKTLRECLDAGFGTIKTARSSFEKVTGKTLDETLCR